MTKIDVTWPGDGYDPKTHITAGELRKIGFNLPSNIPDVAITERSGFMIDRDFSIELSEDGQTVNIGVQAKCSNPFRFGRMEIEVDASADDIIDELK